MYKLQRKNIDQSNGEVISSETTAAAAACTQLIIIWKVKRYSEVRVHLSLIEHDEGHVWDRARLMKLAFGFELVNVQHGPIEETYLMRDSTVLMTSLNLTREEGCYKLEMTISEGDIKDDTRRPLYIDVDR
jgi:hypothetical protein